MLRSFLRSQLLVRLDHLREIAGYVQPHVRRESRLMAVGGVLAVVAGALGTLAALLMASILEVLRSGPPVARTELDLAALLDLNRTGEQVSGYLANFTSGAHSRADAVIVLGLLLIGCTLVAIACNVGSKALWVGVRTRVTTEMQAELLAHLLALPMSFHVRQRTGSLLSRLQVDVTGVGAILPVLFHTLPRTPFMLTATAVVMVRTSVPLTLVAVAAAGTYFVANFLFGYLVSKSLHRQSVNRASFMSIAQEALLSIRIVKVFGAEARELGDMRAQLGKILREEIRSDLLAQQLPAALNELLSVTVAMVVAIAGLRLVADGQLSEQGMIMFIIVSIAFLVTSAIVARAIISVYVLAASAGRVLELWRVRTDIKDGPSIVTAFRGQLQFQDVSFAYGDQPVLRSIDLTLRAGEVIGLVGATGAGKSTLTDLMLRFVDPTSGIITLDGVDIREFQQGSYRRLFGVVPQETLLFNDSVRANIAYGRPDASDDEIRTAAMTANAHDFISALPNDYDTVVGERGTRLSGGERQRVAIARAVLSRPSILIFDEATSALDNESERLVQDAIQKVIKRCSAVIIAHRISTVRNADRIIVLDRGTIVEAGSHDQLLARDGVYRRLYEAGSLERLAPEPATIAAPGQ